MSADEAGEEEFMERLGAVMYAAPGEEVEAVREAVAHAVERGWLGASAAARAARLLAEGIALDAARLLVPAGWSVAVEAVDLGPPFGNDGDSREIVGPDRPPPRVPWVAYVAGSTPDGVPTDGMATHFGPEDACHMPDHAFDTEALALCGEAMMLQLNLAEERSKPP